MRGKFVENWIATPLLFLALALRFESASSASISFALIAAYALFGKRNAIIALAASWLLSLVNPAIAAAPAGAGLGRYAITLSAAISVVIHHSKKGPTRDPRVDPLSLLTIVVGAFLLLHSASLSELPTISMLKAASWLLTFFTLHTAWRALPPVQHAVLFNRLTIAVAAVVLFSLPLIAIPSIGFALNGYGFQGLLAHPQVFGPTASILAALTAGDLLRQKKPPLIHLAVFATAVGAIYLSASRTAGFALIIGILSGITFAPFFGRRSLRSLFPALYGMRTRLVLLACVIALTFTAPMLSNGVSTYLIKGSEATSLLAAADASRGQLVEEMAKNIRDKPLTGIGFGIGSKPEEMEVERDPVFNLPISAPIEKGVLPIAIIEELGLPGAGLIYFWFFVALRRAARAGAAPFLVSMTLLLVNLGESMFFSTGGMGMLLQVLFTGAISYTPYSGRREHETNLVLATNR